MESPPEIPPLPPAAPPVIALPPAKPRQLERTLALLLSLSLALFLADAAVSLLDELLGAVFNLHLLTAIRAMVFLLGAFLAFVVYALMALTPLIPKRWFLPLALFNPAVILAAVPYSIYHYDRLTQFALTVSLIQMVVALGILFGAQGGFKFRWPMVTAGQLTGRRFTWTNLILFLVANIFVVPLVVAVYLGFCAAQAVGHFSQGFVALRPGGITVQVRDYARADGKKIRLVPMAHVGDAAFYRAVSRSFPTNSTILMEGVTDDRNLLTNKISYKRMAKSLGLSEQQREFKPQGEVIHADVDVEVFSQSTIGMLNLIMLMHRDGLNLQTLMMLLQSSPPPEAQAQVWEDLLHKRNRHLLEEIETRLPNSEQLMIPWGAAHMPEISQGIEESGFRLIESHDYTVIRFFGGTREVRQSPPERTKAK